MSASWYDVLGVAPDAGADEIRAAWRDSIADLDPTDRRFALYNEAAGVLLDPARRAEYDAERAAADRPAQKTGADGPTAGTEVDRPAVEPSGNVEGCVAAGDADAPGTPDGPVAAVTRRITGRATGTSRTTGTGRATGVATGRQVPVWLLAVLALATLVVAGAAAWLQFGRTSVEDREDSLAAARSAAESGLPKVFTYDHRFPERDHDQAVRVLTGDLRQEYERLWDEAIRPNLEETRATASSELLGSGIVRGSEEGDRAEILVVLRSVAGNAAADQNQQLTLALTARMVEQDGTWLIEEIDGWDPEAVAGDGEGPGGGSGDGAGDPTEEPSPEPSGPPTEGGSGN